MSKHTEIKYQTIEQNGEPAFAVVQYKEFLALLEERELNKTPTIPHEVVKRNLEDGLSLLRAWREYLDITQEEMAERLSISQGAVAQQEVPNTTPQKRTRKKWADALGLTLDQVTE